MGLETRLRRLLMTTGSFSWIELPGGGDCSATGRFYAQAFGWHVDDDGETVWFNDGSGMSGAFRGARRE
jgi:predicted enzyme related to lactoylglutathione lyase